ncbi:VTT domain-containing protein [Nakamurella flavida]|uniref:VTT domain-containing protein n=1 Tax=Nakamurella flavida TaxID=363630 RepID=A0A938YH23_9ACTN|nr:VTT domain-containing protein [Nakamurella flavida]MBM9477545.1 VTT domain-containing protein [Nakamurella flavida]MDP9779093.1 membrane-associated protein [Nakamurella flavida]
MTSSDLALLPGWLDPSVLIGNMGSWAVLGILLIIFAECGILIGFFLPGDTLLFIAGLLVATSHNGGAGIDINLGLFIGLLALAAFIGNMVGYGIGYKVGPAVFKRPDAKFLKPEYIEKSSAFFAKYGKITIVLARFVPIIRTVATVMAGASRMDPKIYTLYSAIGGVLWVGVVTVAGYFLGQIEFIRDNVDLIVILAVVVVVCAGAVPALLHWFQRRKASGTAGA